MLRELGDRGGGRLGGGGGGYREEGLEEWCQWKDLTGVEAGKLCLRGIQ